MMVDRFNRAHREDRAQSKGHVSAAKRIERNGRQRERQTLAAKFRRRVDRAPAIGDIRFIRRNKTVRHHDFAID